MTRRALVPLGRQAAADQLVLSPGVVSGNHVFLTGMTGSSPDGSMRDFKGAVGHLALAA